MSDAVQALYAQIEKAKGKGLIVGGSRSLARRLGSTSFQADKPEDGVRGIIRLKRAVKYLGRRQRRQKG